MLRSGVAGQYEIHIGNELTKKYEKVADFSNIILDQGLRRMLESSTWFNRVWVSTDDSVPNQTDVGFDGTSTSYWSSTVHVSAAQNTGVDAMGRYHESKLTYRYPSGTFPNNFKIKSVGMGYSTDPQTGAFSKALIRDENGDPTEIELMATDFLDVTYSLRLYPPTEIVDLGVLVLNGEEFLVDARPLKITTNLSSSYTDNTFTSYFGWWTQSNLNFDVFGATNSTSRRSAISNRNFITVPSTATTGQDINGEWPTDITRTINTSTLTVSYSIKFGVDSSNHVIRSVILNTAHFCYGFNFKLATDPTQGIDKNNTQEFTLNVAFSLGRA